MKELTEESVLFVPFLHKIARGEIYLCIDGETPNWVATNEKGAWVLAQIDGKKRLGDLLPGYAGQYGIPLSRARSDLIGFLREALLFQIVSLSPPSQNGYPGRSAFLSPHLSEFWLHPNNSCNLACRHCLVSSSPDADPGLSVEEIRPIIDQASALGVTRYYLTGGEPFLRRDIFDLIRFITEERGGDLVVMTNATLFSGRRREMLKTLDRKKVSFRVSLDGTSPEVNDPIRGEGTFQKIITGATILSDLGFSVGLTSVATRENLDDLVSLPSLAREVGARSVHLMWPHRRGRVLEEMGSSFPSGDELLACARQVRQEAKRQGVLCDNYESLTVRINGLPGIKYDLSHACWGSLCLYADGHLYPSAAFAGYPPLDLGDARTLPLEEIWLTSPVAQAIREATVATGPHDPFMFLVGGGDPEQSYFFSGEIPGKDPYYDLSVGMALDIMEECGQEGKRRVLNEDRPTILHAMGEGACVCGEEVPGPVRTLSSNCVLLLDPDRPRRLLEAFYSKAAEEPQEALCCPEQYDPEEVSHIPADLLKRFYGCGSPVLLAELSQGETVVDLGSGVGIDCFVAAKKVGPTGLAIGVDMTERMLKVAGEAQDKVARNLGYASVRFVQARLESLPLASASASCVVSNCVVNLSFDKRALFSEVFRILRDGGRVVLSDIVSREKTPPAIRVNPTLWGECVGGALTQEEFLLFLERAGFSDLEIIRKGFYREVEGHSFYSLTIRAYKRVEGRRQDVTHTGQGTQTNKLVRVLFLCRGNSCRSQMGEGFGRALGEGIIEAFSAGPEPLPIHPLTYEVMREKGVDISSQRSKSLDQLGIEPDIVITTCGEPDEVCPTYPRRVRLFHWPLRDPARVRGTHAEVLSAFRAVRDQIEENLRDLLHQLRREQGE